MATSIESTTLGWRSFLNPSAWTLPLVFLGVDALAKNSPVLDRTSMEWCSRILAIGVGGFARFDEGEEQEFFFFFLVAIGVGG